MNDRMLKFYMDFAEQCAQMSRAIRLKVGGVLVKDTNILSFSWNGTPAGWDNKCENDLGDSKPEVIHCEKGLIGKAASEGKCCHGSTMIITHAPCAQCATLVMVSGVKEVIFKELYVSSTSNGEEGLALLIQHGISVSRIA